MAHMQEAVEKAWAEVFPELTRLRYEADFTRPILERYAVKLVKKQYREICVPIL